MLKVLVGDVEVPLAFCQSFLAFLGLRAFAKSHERSKRIAESSGIGVPTEFLRVVVIGSVRQNVTEMIC
ncbi:MAG: hypothetical protein U0793_28220 [Gemmataceae bacterium]